MQTPDHAITPAPADTCAVLVIEDDRRLAATLETGLRENGFDVTIAHTAAAADQAMQAGRPALIVLDLGLPDRDGIDLLRAMRQQHDTTPVLILTARDAVDARVTGLNAGADDYLPKPFSFAELLARLRALARRHHTRGIAGKLTVADLTIDLLRREVQRAGRRIELSPREFDVLLCLTRNAGATVSRDTLMRDAWHTASRATSMDNVIDVLMTRLRDKLDKDFAPPLLQTVRGVGFRLQAAP